MKIFANSKLKNVHGFGNIIKVDSHSWRTPNEGDTQNSDNCPIVGYSYQPFLKEIFFTSLLRPNEISQIEVEVRSGKQLHVVTLMNFADCHAKVLETLLADGKVTATPFCGYSLAHVALMHFSAGNGALSGTICEHIFRQGNGRQVFRDSARTFIDNEEIGLHYLEQAMPIIDMAERVVLHEKLGRDLSAKSTSKQVKI